MTSRASFIGFAIHLTADTAPEARFFPSMIIASISTSPSSLRTEPQPKDQRTTTTKIKIKKRSKGKRIKSLRANQQLIQFVDLIKQTFSFPNMCLTYWKYLPPAYKQNSRNVAEYNCKIQP